MLEFLKQLLDVDCKESLVRKPMAARLCVLEIFARKGPYLSYEEILNTYGKGSKGYLKKVISYLEHKGFIEKINDKYRLTSKGYAITQRDPPCPTLFLAGADAALRVAFESGVRPLNWLLSAGRYWNGREFVRSPDFEMAKSLAGQVFLDSGAQQFYSKIKGLRYPYSAKQYVDFAARVGADLVATLDLPLDILVPRGLSVGEGVKSTVDLSVEVVAAAEELGLSAKIVPVLQGYDSPEQWLECLDLFKQHGVSPQKFRLWGLGSLCMAKSVKLVRSVVSEVKKALGDAAIHVFGVSMNSLRKIYNLIDSYDTSAWVYWAKMDGAALVWSGRRKAFIHLQARDGRRYSTEDLMEINMNSIIRMHWDLCKIYCCDKYDLDK